MSSQDIWKCSNKRPCTSKRLGIGRPHQNCIFPGFCTYQFYVAAGKIPEEPKEVHS